MNKSYVFFELIDGLNFMFISFKKLLYYNVTLLTCISR